MQGKARAAMAATAGEMPAGFVHVPDFLPRVEQDTLLRQLQSLHFEHDRFRGQRLKRSSAQFGHTYMATGRQLAAAAPMPEFLRILAEKGALRCGIPDSFDQCIVTRYTAGAGIGWHTDAPRFGGDILAISLGGEGRLQFRRNGSQAVACEVRVASGSLYLLSGAARWDYQHRVVPVRAERYSLTFRHVIL